MVIVRELVEEVRAKWGMTEEVEVSWDERAGAIKVQMEAENSGLLIGRHGATIEAIQVVLAGMIGKRLGRWLRVVCNVGDYREQREETLVQLALNTAKKAKFSGEAQKLTGLTASERRIVHMALANDAEVETFSEGEGEGRLLVINTKK